MAGKPKDRDLSPAEILFCQEYVRTSHLSNSAKTAWPSLRSDKAANNKARNLLKRPQIIKRVAEIQEKIHGNEDSIIDDSRRTKRELDLLVHIDPASFFSPGSEEHTILMRGGEHRRAVKSIKITTRNISEIELEKTVELDFYDKNAAILTDCKVKNLLAETMKVLHISKPEVYVPENGRNRPANEEIAVAG